jgi:hypothetical protein
MAPERPKQFLLGVLVVVLLLVGARAWRSTSEAPLASSQGRGRGAAAARAAPAAAEAPDVHLDALAADRRTLVESQRNLFRFKPKVAPPPPATAARVAAPPLLPPTGPPPPPPVPAIPLKFIGIVETAGKSQRLAVLSDGRGGMPFSGKEGDIIEGRYRILRIGSESIEMAYLDGRGRQTIRLSGS